MYVERERESVCREIERESVYVERERVCVCVCREIERGGVHAERYRERESVYI